ncbi:hypothetical protein ACFLZT_00650 [Thermodesulfobacteriota bacterium]
MGEKRTAIILILIAIIAVGATIFAYNFKDEINLPNKFEDTKDKLFTIKGLNVKFSINTSIAKESLSIRYFIPCSTIEQRIHFLKNLPAIKHSIMMAMSRPRMMTAIQKRNFESIKKYSLKVINKYSIRAVDTVYIDYFSMQSLH